MGVTPAFTRFAYTPPGYAAAGSPASRQRIAADRRADTIQKTADRHPGNAPIQAINIPIQAEKKLKQTAETAADSGRNTADRQTQKTAAADRFFIVYRLSLFSHCIQYREGKEAVPGKETDRRQKPDRIADAAGIVRHPGRHKNALQDRVCFAVSVRAARLLFRLPIYK